jgi:DNA-binding GntR family transcriptional regulator
MGYGMTGADTDGQASAFSALVERYSAGYRTVGEMVYGVIKDAIVGGTLAPGARLRQEALAEAIGVSRIPVRSALMQLESEGLVLFHPRRGAVVRSLSAREINEVYELRLLLERHALAKSIDSMTEERLSRLRPLAAKVDHEHGGADFAAARVEFYELLYDIEENPQLLKLIGELRSAVGPYLLGLRVSAQHTSGHRELVDIVGRHDRAAAFAWLDQHLGAVRDAVAQLVAQSDDAAAIVG